MGLTSSSETLLHNSSLLKKKDGRIINQNLNWLLDRYDQMDEEMDLLGWYENSDGKVVKLEVVVKGKIKHCKPKRFVVCKNGPSRGKQIHEAQPRSSKHCVKRKQKRIQGDFEADSRPVDVVLSVESGQDQVILWQSLGQRHIRDPKKILPVNDRDDDQLCL